MARRGPLQVAFPLFSNATSAALSVICAALGEFVPSNKSQRAPHTPKLRLVAFVGSSRLSGPLERPAFASYFARRGPSASRLAGGPAFARHGPERRSTVRKRRPARSTSPRTGQQHDDEIGMSQRQCQCDQGVEQQRQRGLT
jgi:hypothetical protein